MRDARECPASGGAAPTWSRWRKALFALALCLWSNAALAGGPRWYIGPPFYTGVWSAPVLFWTMTPMYATDPGDLSAAVPHAQADAMVAAAAAVWNVPTSRLTLAQGGVLAEHVSDANVYFDGTQMVFPADVQASNYKAVPIAVVYDTDGSVIDTLLGAGASEPSGCRQNAVVEHVDGFDPGAGTITHAMLMLNGRCVGANGPGSNRNDQMLQMQYQLARAFGRVLGVGWSQLNDDVFMGTTAPTALELEYWPLMHPIDVICGSYTYKCMTDPFRLRPDDLQTLATLYPVTAANLTSEKTLTAAGALGAQGNVRFPTTQGMSMVNVVARRSLAGGYPVETALIVSALTGPDSQQMAGNPVTGAPSGPAESSGGPYAGISGRFFMWRIPMLNDVMGVTLTTEPINPLYTGEYALAPYPGVPPTPSGSGISASNSQVAQRGLIVMDGISAGAASLCNPGNDGTETVPVGAAASGWWTGQLCADGHTSWGSQSVRAGRSWTLEVTALDESGSATEGKVHPLIGVWNAADAAGTLPTVAATAAPFNGLAAGMTQVHVPSSAVDTAVRFAVADERGHGRPDFGYKARLMYAESVSPAVLLGNAVQITIEGMGFKTGNRVLVNGVAANVTSWAANTIMATAPSRAAAHAAVGAAVDVTVTDASTGATTVISGAVSYAATAAVDSIALVSAPTTAETGLEAGRAVVVRVTEADGLTPVADASVTFAVTRGAASLAACGAAACVVRTDAQGLAATLFTASAAGVLTVQAMEMSGGASVAATVTVSDPVRAASTVAGARFLAAASAAAWNFSVTVLQDGAALAGVPVVWSSTGGAGVVPGSSSSVTDASGMATVPMSTAGVADGAAIIVQGCAWTTVCAGVPVFGVGPAAWMLGVVSGGEQSVPASAALEPVVLRVTDGAAHPLQGAAVSVYQTVSGWEGTCASGRCPAAPVLAKSQASLVSDADGLVTVMPLEVSGVASVVKVAAATGTQGFLAMELLKTP